VEAKLVAINVPRGSGYDSQSGLNNLFPQVMVAWQMRAATSGWHLLLSTPPATS
jgi:hypothetical protein